VEPVTRPGRCRSLDPPRDAGPPAGILRQPRRSVGLEMPPILAVADGELGGCKPKRATASLATPQRGPEGSHLVGGDLREGDERVAIALDSIPKPRREVPTGPQCGHQAFSFGSL
jgi:hypothetical protein